MDQGKGTTAGCSKPFSKGELLAYLDDCSSRASRIHNWFVPMSGTDHLGASRRGLILRNRETSAQLFQFSAILGALRTVFVPWMMSHCRAKA